MMEFFVTLIVTAISMIVTAYIIPGIVISSASAALIGAFIFGIVNAIVKPLLILFTLPATILSLGLFLFVVNALCFWLVGYFTPGFEVKGFLMPFLARFLFLLFLVF